MDALKQTIKSLRDKRDYLEKELESAQTDAKKQKAQYSRLDQQFHNEKVLREKLETHLRSLGVDVDRYGNIKVGGASRTPKVEVQNNTPHIPEISSAPRGVKQEDALNTQQTISIEDNQPVVNQKPEDPTPADIKIKIKKGKKFDHPPPLPLDVRARFLQGTSLFPIDPDPLPVAVGRYALNKAYGSATVAMSWTKDDRRFLWPSYDWNPDMPRGVGEPGLLLEVHSIYCDGQSRTLFYKILKSNPVMWAYAGEYIGCEAGKLWKEEYARLGDIVHKTRARQMLRDRSEPDAGSDWQRIKARIVLRKSLPAGTEPSEEQIQAELPNLTLDISQEYPPDYLTCQDITDAFVRGDEHLVVSKLECVAYDHAKAAEFIDVQKRYEELKAAKTPKSEKGKKRKDTTPPLDSLDLPEEEEDSPRPTKRSKPLATSKPHAQPSIRSATSLPSTPSSSRSVRVRVKSRKLQELEL